MTMISNPRVQLRVRLRSWLNRVFARLELATAEGPWRTSRLSASGSAPVLETSRPRKFENYERLEQLAEEIHAWRPDDRLIFGTGAATDSGPGDVGIHESVAWLSRLPATKRRRVVIGTQASPHASTWGVSIANVDDLTTSIQVPPSPDSWEGTLQRLLLEYTVPMTRKEQRQGAPVLGSADLRTTEQFAHEREVARDAAKIGGRRGLWAGVLGGIVSGVATVWATTGWPF